MMNSKNQKEPAHLAKENLHRLYLQLNATWWRGKLPPPQVRWSERMHAAAGKFSISRKRWEIVLSAPYHRRFPDEIEDTLKHEMIHLHLYQKGKLRHGLIHGAEFQDEAARVGASLHCKHHEGMHRPLRYEWECPSCATRSRSRIRRDWACKRCCSQHNGGVYSPRFKLRLIPRDR
ncbi:SprT-like domain-containing protein [Candidatus Acetothermia bacterium]|nr:SprT-like domain-containing protein [Candidatus Acetothermia bacterium]